MKNKYYTPDIEEFKVGFEYEIKPTLDNNWDNCKAFTFPRTPHNLGGNDQLGYIRDAINRDCIRIKHLDQQDIEGCGFVETYRDWFLMPAPGCIKYWTEIAIDFRWYYSDCAVAIKGKRGEELADIFSGYIKNKSQLQDLLSMLNIK